MILKLKLSQVHLTQIRSRLVLVFFICINSSLAVCQEHNSMSTEGRQQGRLITETLISNVLQNNLVGIDPKRSIKIYLPPSYSTSNKSYPVIYYCHNSSTTPEQMFADGNVVKLLENGIAEGIVKEFILVASSYITPTGGCLYENSVVNGRWIDYTVNELVPFIESRFRVIKHRDSRGIVGDFIGGRGAIKLAMLHADLFSVLYALHPVATGIGYLPWAANPVDWKKIHSAKTFSELPPGRERIFVQIAQSTLPNPNRPPFYCDFWMELENGEPKLHPEKTRKAQAGWHLDETLDEYADNLRAMRGIAIDWARYDPTQTHVYSVEAFSKKLVDLGVEHEAEEYLGDPWNKNWTENGRFFSRVLPFLDRNLAF